MNERVAVVSYAATGAALHHKIAAALSVAGIVAVPTGSGAVVLDLEARGERYRLPDPTSLLEYARGYGVGSPPEYVHRFLDVLDDPSVKEATWCRAPIDLAAIELRTTAYLWRRVRTPARLIEHRADKPLEWTRWKRAEQNRLWKRYKKRCKREGTWI